MSEKTSTHSLIAATLHLAVIQGYKKHGGLPLPEYKDESHYPMWEESVKALIEMFPQIMHNSPPVQDSVPETIEVELAATRHTHWSHAVMSPDGCIDRNSIAPTVEMAWQRVMHDGIFNPTRVAQFRAVGYTITRVRVDHDPLPTAR